MPSTASTAPAWMLPADQLRAALAALSPRQRRAILDYISAPPEPSRPKTYAIGDCAKAAERVTALLLAHPSWTQAKARATTARELGISTVQLRRMLRHVEQ